MKPHVSSMYRAVAVIVNDQLLCISSFLPPIISLPLTHSQVEDTQADIGYLFDWAGQRIKALPKQRGIVVNTDQLLS